MSIKSIIAGVGICLAAAGLTIAPQPAAQRERPATVSPPGWERWQPKGFSGSYSPPATAREIRVPGVDGTRSVKCQAPGKEHRVAGHSNYWWLLTGDDSSDHLVWINSLSVKGGVDNEPVPGVPGCREA